MNKMFKSVVAMAVVIAGLVATQQSATAQDIRANFFTNLTAVVITSNDVTSSPIVLDLASGNRYSQTIKIKTPTMASISWKLGSVLTTGEVVNLVEVPSNSVYTIETLGGYNLALSMRMHSGTNNPAATTNIVQIQVVGFQ